MALAARTPVGNDQPAATANAGSGQPNLVRACFLVSSAFGVIAALLYLAGGVGLVWPEAYEGVGVLSYGRLRPMGTAAAMFGWLGLGVVGVAYQVVPRALGRALWGSRVAALNLAAGSAAILAGIAAIGLGGNRGVLYFELPLWATALVAVSLLVSLLIIVRTVAGAPPSGSAALWFSVAGVLWLLMGFGAVAIPGLRGVNSALQNWFGFTGFAVLGLVSGAIGAAYSVVGELSGEGWFGTRLSRIGFWSFAFAAGWVAPRFLVFGPGPDWLETLGVVFSIVLLIPVATILADLARPMRGRWTGSVRARSLLGGGMALAVLVLHNLLQSLRSASSMIQFTGFHQAFEIILFFGVGGLLLASFVHDRGPSRRELLAFRATVLGLVVTALSLWAAGIQQGVGWLGEANAMQAPPGGDGFRSSVVPLQAWRVGAVVGFGFLAIGMVLFLVGLIGRAGRGSPTAGAMSEDVEAARPISMTLLVRGAAALFLFAALGVWLIPALDAPNREASLLGQTRDFPSGSPEALGRKVYVAEGCMYCHTLQVRSIVTDVGLGPVSQPGDFVFDSPQLLGSMRIGPDLSHVGSRPPTDSVRFNREHLRDPRQGEGGRSWSIMPSFDHLSDVDIANVAQYISALK